MRGPEAVPRSAQPALRLGRSAQQRPERLARRHSAQAPPFQAHPQAARRDGPSAREAALLVRPQRAVSPELRRGAAVRSCFRRGEAWSSARWSAPVRPERWQVPAAAWRQPVEAAAARVRASPSAMKAAAVVAEAAQQVASAPWALLPVEVAAEASGATVRPPVAAAVSPVPSAQRPGAAEVGEAGSAVEAQPPAAGWDAAGPQRVVAEAGQPDAAAVRLPAVGAEARRDAGELQPAEAAAALRAPSARRPAAEHPSAPPWPCREGQNLPWLAPRQAERSAHAMRRSRAASPSRRL